MNFETFIPALKKELQEHYPAYSIKIGNDKEKQVITVNRVCHLNLDQLYAYYNTGVTMKEVADQVDTLVKYSLTTAGKLENYEDIRKDITIVMINAEKHKEKVEKGPHRMVADLALMYVVKLGNIDGKEARAHITYAMLKEYGITEEQVYAQAVQNSISLLSFEDVVGMKVPEESFVHEAMVLTNEERCYGAAALWYAEAQQILSEVMQGNFYVIPSSVHELILLKDNLTLEDIEGVESTIQSTNEEIVEDSDFLSNHLYYYDVSSQTLCLARERQDIGRVATEKTFLLGR